MKKILFPAILCVLLITIAFPAAGLSLSPPEEFNEMYYYYYVDYNFDDVYELAVIGGEPGGYAEREYPEYKIHVLKNGEVRTLQPEKNSARLAGAPAGYRNKNTDKLQWFFYDHRSYKLKNANNNPELSASSWGRIHEVVFDFETYTYCTKELDKENNDWVAREQWKNTWKIEPYHDSMEGAGVLTEEVILQLLLDAPATDPTDLTELPQTGHTNYLLALSAAVCLLSAITAVLLIDKKRRQLYAP